MRLIYCTVLGYITHVVNGLFLIPNDQKCILPCHKKNIYVGCPFSLECKSHLYHFHKYKLHLTLWHILCHDVHTQSIELAFLIVSCRPIVGGVWCGPYQTLKRVYTNINIKSPTVRYVRPLWKVQRVVFHVGLSTCDYFTCKLIRTPHVKNTNVHLKHVTFSHFSNRSVSIMDRHHTLNLLYRKDD